MAVVARDGREGEEADRLLCACLTGAVAFLESLIAPAGGGLPAYEALIGGIALPLGIAFADGQPTLVAADAAPARAEEVEAVARPALAAAPRGAARGSTPVWSPAAHDGAAGGWVWCVGADAEAVALCLLAGSQAKLAFTPAAPQVVGLCASLIALAQHLRGETHRTRAQAAALAQEKVRAETLTVELEQAVRTIDSFTALAAHELRTPLSALMLQTDSAQRLIDRDPVPLERVGHKVKAISRQVERLRHLVEDLLDVSRLESPSMVMRPARTDLAAVAREVAGRLEEAFSRAHTPFTAHIAGSLVGTFDAARVEQVLSNLLSNALKYGLGRPVDLTVSGHANGAVIAVVDRGIGIAPAQHAHIFSRYGRAVSERDYGGLGLGLWISKQIVVGMGGHIELDSAPGAGSTFRVHLPLAPPAPS